MCGPTTQIISGTQTAVATAQIVAILTPCLGSPGPPASCATALT
jgi:hypothetical protein